MCKAVLVGSVGVRIGSENWTFAQVDNYVQEVGKTSIAILRTFFVYTRSSISALDNVSNTMIINAFLC